ncbi:hypothetical protein NMG60_11036716 [Bertholletia excelsa]
MEGGREVVDRETREMTKISGGRSLRLLLLFSAVSLQFIAVLSNDSSTKNEKKVANQAGSSGGIGSKILVGCIVIVVVATLSFVLFKLWQKRKREEQHARLLKLFEEDDDLEVELGLGD